MVGKLDFRKRKQDQPSWTDSCKDFTNSVIKYNPNTKIKRKKEDEKACQMN